MIQTLENNFKDDSLWNRVLMRLKFVHGEATFNGWFKALKLDSIEGGVVIISSPTRFIKDWVSSKYSDDILSILQEEIKDKKIFRVDIRSEKKANFTRDVVIKKEDETNLVEEPTSFSGLTNGFTDPRFTFKNFVTDDSNKLAYVVAKKIAKSADVLYEYNPLFLYGGVGVGKTHILHAIKRKISEFNPKRKVVYLSAERFMYHFVKSLRSKDTMSFKEYFHSIDVLMVDDIQFICGKKGTQEEFLHVFNMLVNNNCQVIVCGDRSPSAFKDMTESMRSRLGGGLVVDIGPANYNLRLKVIKSKIARLEDNVDIEENVADFLAKNITNNLRELEGAFNKLVMHSQMLGLQVDIKTAERLLRDLLHSRRKQVTIDDIKQRVAETFSITVADLQSKKRSRNIAAPRQIAIYLAKKHTSHSLPEIGNNFGGKDHSTIIYAIKKVEGMLSDSAMASKISNIEESFAF